MYFPDELFHYLQYVKKIYGNIVQIHAINLQAILLSDPDDVEVNLFTFNMVALMKAIL